MENLKIDGVFSIRRKHFDDERGFFTELYRSGEYPLMKQFNVSRSTAGVARGMHFQIQKPQAKMVTVLSGVIVDFILDLRPESPTFKQSMSYVLSEYLPESLFIPQGCAHGFFVTVPAIVHYGCSEIYNPEWDRGIHLHSVFPDYGESGMSAKDEAWPSLEEYLEGIE